MIFLISKCYYLHLFCVFLLCRDVFALCISEVSSSCVKDHWLYTLLLCRRLFSLWSFHVEIVKMLSGESEDIEQVSRTSKHISCLRLAFSLNSTLVYILHCYYFLFIFAWYCAYICFGPRKLLKPHNSYKKGILRRNSRALHWNSDSLLEIYLCVSFYCLCF